MITDEQMDSLPDDDDAAFVMYEQILRDVVRRKVSIDSYDIERDYVAHMLAFVDERTVPVDLPRNPPRDNREFGEWYQEFIQAVDYFKAAIRIRISVRRRKGEESIFLGPDFKTRIGGHLTAIQNIVLKSDITEQKRDAILRRLSALQDEVLKDKTRTEKVIGLWLDITSAIGQGAENLSPAIDRLEKVMGVFADARDENEQKRLSAPQERKRLPAPTVSHISDNNEEISSDEIPF